MSLPDILSLFDKHGVLPTPQRLEVAEVLLARPQHLSADQILERLKDGGSRVSKATVYNTLNLFSDRGLVREVMVDPVRRAQVSSCFFTSYTTGTPRNWKLISLALPNVISAVMSNNSPVTPASGLSPGWISRAWTL
jgi:DNA-binding transcriptional ArsR family regulator